MLMIKKIKNMKVLDFERESDSLYKLLLSNRDQDLKILFSFVNEQLYINYSFESDCVNVDFETNYKLSNVFFKNEHDKSLFSKKSLFYKNRKKDFYESSTERSDEFTSRINYQFFASTNDLSFVIKEEWSFYRLLNKYFDLINEDSGIMETIKNNSIPIYESMNDNDKIFENILKDKSLSVEEKSDLIELNYKI